MADSERSALVDSVVFSFGNDRSTTGAGGFEAQPANHATTAMQVSRRIPVGNARIVITFSTQVAEVEHKQNDQNHNDPADPFDPAMDRLLGALAAEQGSLRRTVALLGPTTANANRAVTALNNALDDRRDR